MIRRIREQFGPQAADEYQILFRGEVEHLYRIQQELED